MEELSDAEEFFQERAAILQFDAGMVRHTADYYATARTYDYCQRTGSPEPLDSYYRTLVGYFHQNGFPYLPGQTDLLT